MSGRGKTWEALLAATFEAIDGCGIKKVDPPLRFARRGGSRMRYGSGGKGDFEGRYGGVRFVIEAKDADAADGFGRETKISESQIARLRQVAAEGGVGALCLRLRAESGNPEDDVLWIIEWRMFETFPWPRKRVKPVHVRSAWSVGLGGRLAYGAGIVNGIQKWMDSRVESRALARAV